MFGIQISYRRRLGSAFSLAGILLLLAGLGGGCAGSVQNVHQAEDFDAARLRDSRLGVGGFVLGSRVQLDSSTLDDGARELVTHADQTDEWAPILYSQLLTQRRDLTTWPWPSVRDQVPADLLAAIHETFARGGVLDPEQVQQLRTYLPALDLMALGRVEGTTVSINDNDATDREMQRMRDGDEATTASLSSTKSTRREAEMTLDIYDLHSGQLVWSGSVKRHRDQLYYPDADGNPGGVQVQPADGDNPGRILVGGKGVPAPPLAEVLEFLCEGLVQELPAEER